MIKSYLELITLPTFSERYEYLKIGGVMVYSTCTLNKEENEENVKWFLENHKDAEIVTFFVGKGRNLKYDREGSLTIFPDSEMDGFFVTKFIKK